MISKTAILVDDDQDDLDILEESISEFLPETACFQFKNALEAMDSISNQGTVAPSFIFLDYNMPMMTGEKCAYELRKNHRLDRTIIVVMSTSMPAETAMHLKDVGVNYAFQKPSSFRTYQSILEKIAYPKG